jgi:hypothetical protein
MSPELIAPPVKNSRPTIFSDCYALGMVIYETISGNLPFHEYSDLTVVVKVLAGEQPPRGAWFVGSLWKLLEECWTSRPNDRPSIEDVLERLDTVSDLPEPHFLGEETEEDGEDNGYYDLSALDRQSPSPTPIIKLTTRLSGWFSHTFNTSSPKSKSGSKRMVGDVDVEGKPFKKPSKSKSGWLGTTSKTVPRVKTTIARRDPPRSSRYGDEEEDYDFTQVPQMEMTKARDVGRTYL